MSDIFPLLWTKVHIFVVGVELGMESTRFTTLAPALTGHNKWSSVLNMWTV
jgi:hypothetical protein